MALTLRYVVADVFTDTPLTGNQLAVFTDGREVDDATMQNLAREMNLSETVFVLPAEAGGHARIRIFTPVAELPFAGHPTLGSAFVLAQPLQLSEIRLETGAGIVPVRLEREGAADHVRLDDAARAAVAAVRARRRGASRSSASSRSCRSTGTTSGRRSCTWRCARPKRWRRCGRTSRS